jgi:hypothetical protein
LKAPLIAVISVGIAAAAPAVAISANEPVKALSQISQDAKRQTNTGTGSVGNPHTPIGPVTIQQNQIKQSNRHKRLVKRFVRLRNRANRLIARRAGRKPHIVRTAVQASWSHRALRRAIRVLRKRVRKLHAAIGPGLTPAVRSTLERIAACESHGNPRSIGGGGAFRGKYQFTYWTWAAVGGKGDPAAASEAEQDHRASLLLARSGTSPWPVCG